MQIKLRKCFEYLLIVSIGVYLHINRISILDLKVSKLPGLVPSLSSTLFIFSILIILVEKLPSWPKQLMEPTWIIKLLIECFLVLYVTDLVMRNFWVPVLKVVGFLCNFLSQSLSRKLPSIAMWVSRNGYFLARFLIAISSFILMVEVVDVQSIYKEILSGYERQCTPVAVPVPSEPSPSTSEIVRKPIYGRSRSNSRSKKTVTFKDSIYSSNHLPASRQLFGLPANDEDNQCSICHSAM